MFSSRIIKCNPLVPMFPQRKSKYELLNKVEVLIYYKEIIQLQMIQLAR